MSISSNILKYKILKEKRISIQYFSGSIEKKDVMNFVSEMKADADFNATFNTIIDLRNAQVNITENEVKEYVDFIKNVDNFISKRKIVVITSNPNQYISAFFSKQYSKDLPLQFNIFSSVEPALFYLDLLDFTTEKYNQIISEFRA